MDSSMIGLRTVRKGTSMVDYGVFRHLIVDKQDGIAWITMNRPEVYNATNGRLHYELGRIWLDIGADTEVRVAIITGAGKAFSAGGDLDLIEECFGDAPRLGFFGPDVREGLQALREKRQPNFPSAHG